MVAKKQKTYRVTLQFESAFDKRYFLGQMSDGLGENFVDMTWSTSCSLHEAGLVRIRMIRDEYYLHARNRPKRMRELKEKMR